MPSCRGCAQHPCRLKPGAPPCGPSIDDRIVIRRGGMEVSVLMAAAVAGAIVVLTPGPAVLALLGIGAAQGRRAGAGFLIGHLVGDTLWAMLALTALIGAKVIAPVVFKVLALVCGGYLLYLGIRAVMVRRDATGQVNTAVRQPL